MTPDETPKDDVVEETTETNEAAEVEAKASEEAAASKPAAKASAAGGGRGGERSETGAKPKAKAKAAAKKAAEPAETGEPEEAAAPKAAAKPKAKAKAKAKAKPSAQPEAPSKRAARGRNGRRPEEPAVLVRAQAKYVRTSARKARLVCDHIRGKDVAQARAILAFTPRGVAKDWSKLLESAIANAENNHELVGEELRIHSVVADEGPTLKRFRPRAMGRATRIRKRTSHLTITLTPKES
jgi:ribosomal protein L22